MIFSRVKITSCKLFSHVKVIMMFLHESSLGWYFISVYVRVIIIIIIIDVVVISFSLMD